MLENLIPACPEDALTASQLLGYGQPQICPLLCVSRDPISDPHSCVTSTLFTEFSLVPPYFLKTVFLPGLQLSSRKDARHKELLGSTSQC